MNRSGCEIGGLFGLASRLGIWGLPILCVWAGKRKLEIAEDPDKLFSSHDLCCVFPKISAVSQGVSTVPGSS